jgi:Leucine Rich repeat
MSASPILPGSQVEDAMAGADSQVPGDAIPVVDAAARALDARRMHHRQIVRRGVITTLVVAIVGLLTAVAVPVVNQLKMSWLMQAAGFSVDWQIDEDNWMSGGVTNVYFKQLRSWPPNSHDPDLRILPRLLNVESLGLSECAVTEQELASLRGLNHLRSLNLARLNHLRYGSPDTGLSDACLIPIQGLTRLETLTLSGNRITDQGLALIARMPALENLDLDATDVTDAGLVHLQSLKKLKTLALGGTRVTQEGVKTLQKALPGLEISMDIDPEVERVVKESRRANP